MKKRKPALNALQLAQLRDSIREGCTVRVNGTPKSMNKGYTDTPLFFRNDQGNLFNQNNTNQ